MKHTMQRNLKSLFNNLEIAFNQTQPQNKINVEIPKEMPPQRPFPQFAHLVSPPVRR